MADRIVAQGAEMDLPRQLQRSWRREFRECTEGIEMERFHAWLSPWIGSQEEVFLGMEPTGHYYEPCAYELGQRYGAERVYLIQAWDVAHRREEWSQGGFKNDEVDACIIAELLRQGHGRRYQLPVVQIFREANYWVTQPYAEKILQAVNQLCVPSRSLAAIRSTLLHMDLQRLAQLEQEQANIEAVMVSYLDQTWGRWLRSTGVDPARLACLVACTGDIVQYTSARQLFGRSGLHSRCSDSGTRQHRGQGERMVKAGDRHLRRQLMRFAVCMLARYPALRSYKAHLVMRGKRNITAQIAVARKRTGIIYALGTRQVPFDPALLA